MWKQGVLDKPIFSVFISDKDEQLLTGLSSNIIFGGYDLQTYSSESEFKFVDLIPYENKHW